MAQALLQSRATKNVQLVLVEPDVKSAKTFKLFNAGVSGNRETAKSADPTCYNFVTVELTGLFDNRRTTMKRNQQVVIKALRERGGIITWCYDTPRQASRLWGDLVKSGRAPDTGEALASACYFLGDKVEPHGQWSKVTTATIINAKTGKPVTREEVAARFN